MTSPHASADFGRGGMMTAENLAKLERLTKLREVCPVVTPLRPRRAMLPVLAGSPAPRRL
jgi:hypothetical protein